MIQHLFTFLSTCISYLDGGIACLVCGGYSRVLPLCTDCMHTITAKAVRDWNECCNLCGQPLISARRRCPSCRTIERFSALDGIHPVLPYQLYGHVLLAAWKLEGNRRFGPFFASLLEPALRTDVLAGRVLVPVPPRPGKIRSRGWDQVEDLAVILEKKFDIQVSRCLVRTGGRQQKKLGRLDRAVNLCGAFEVCAGVPDSAVLLDDLVTTGATLDSCADVLRAAGSRTVRALTLFHD